MNFLLNTVTKVKETPDNIDVFNQTYQGKFRPDYGANLGITFSPNKKFNFQLRYFQGLKNLINTNDFQDYRSFNIALQIAAGYVIF